MLLPGALVRWNDGFHRVADPLRHFADGLGSLPNPVGSPLDKVLVGLFRLKSLLKTPDAIFQSPETTTYSRLKVGRIPSCLCCRECTFCLMTSSSQSKHLSWCTGLSSAQASYCSFKMQVIVVANGRQLQQRAECNLERLLYRQRASQTPS